MTEPCREGKENKSLVVVGNSMYPTLRALDVVTIMPCDGNSLRAGEVIVFPHPEKAERVIHRIITVSSQGITTRGDNRRFADSWLVSPDAVLGKVASARRGKKPIRVYGGFMGRLTGDIHFIRTSSVSLIMWLVFPVYLKLGRSGIFRKLLPVGKKPRVISFQRPEGIERQLVMGKRVVGVLLPGHKHWVIKPPYRLFIDESSLMADINAGEKPGSREVDEIARH